MALWKILLDQLNSIYPDRMDTLPLTQRVHANQEEVAYELKQLKAQGFPIEIKGDAVALSCPVLSESEIVNETQTVHIANQVTLFKEIGSTNLYAKENLDSLRHGHVLLAHEQVSGKGRLGRAWTSPAGKSISMTLVIKPDKMMANANLLTQLTAASLVDALKGMVDLRIKWPNDVVVGNKKIAGILTEAEFSGNQLAGIIIGMGVNTNLEKRDFPEELFDKATSLREVFGQAIDPNALLARFFESFETYYSRYVEFNQTEPFLEVCRTHSALIGRRMWVHYNGEKKPVTIDTINTEGGLVVTDLQTGKQETLTSTHYSIRGDHGYL